MSSHLDRSAAPYRLGATVDDVTARAARTPAAPQVRAIAPAVARGRQGRISVRSADLVIVCHIRTNDSTRRSAGHDPKEAAMFNTHPAIQFDIQIARHHRRSHPAVGARDVAPVRWPLRARSR